MKASLSRLFALEQKVLALAAVRKTTAAFSGPKGFFAVLTVIACVYSFRVAYHPGYHGDEMGLMALPYRVVEYGDYKYPLIFSDTYNAGAIRLYPPMMAVKLRTWWHLAAGFSDYASRLFSGLMMGTLAGLFGWLMYRRTGNWGLSVAALVCVGLNPAVVTAARTVRFEQEIVFMGGLAFLLPLLFAGREKRWASRVMWVASGLCAAWAGFSHPWGLVFPFVLVMSFLFLHRQWRENDGLGWVGRVFFFSVGCLTPFLETTAQILLNHAQFLDYLSAIGEFYAMRKDLMIEYFLNRYNIPLEPGLAGRVAAAFLQLHMTGYGATATKLSGIDVLPVGFLFQAVFWGFIAATGSYCLKFPASRGGATEADNRLDVALFCFLALAFVLFGMIYVPNQVYVLYAGLFVVVAALFLRAASGCRLLETGVRAYTGLCLVFSLSYLVFLAFSPRVQETIPLDERYAAFRAMNEALGLKGGIIYADSSTWYAAGRNMRAYTDAFLTGRMRPSSALVVDAETFNAQVKSLGDMSGGRGRDLLARELSHKVLRGLIAIEQWHTGYYYLMPGRADDPLRVTFYDVSGVKRDFSGAYSGIIPPGARLSSGWHLLLAPPSSPTDFSFLEGVSGVRIRFARKGGQMWSVALVEAQESAELKKTDAGVMLLPLREGLGEK